MNSSSRHTPKDSRQQIVFTTDTALLKAAKMHANAALQFSSSQDLYIGLFIAGYQFARSKARIK